MKIYIDSDYKCHISNDGTMREFEVPDFDGKCAEFIEGYRYVPPGEKWVKQNGMFFRGEMISPWKDYTMLAALQAAYEEGKATSGSTDEEKQDMQAALELLGVKVNG
jgi:hypothetical protein